MGINELIADSRVTLTRKQYDELAASTHTEVSEPNPVIQQQERTQGTSAATEPFTTNPNIDNEDWDKFANCLGVDPDLFYPERGASTRAAKEVCRACVVRDDCLEYALKNGERFGIWGGMSERERRRIRRQRAIGRAASLDVQPN